MRRVLSRAIATVLVLALCSANLSAQTLLELAKREGARLAETQQPTPASSPNPYLWPGLAVIGGGISLAIVGFTDETGAEIDVPDPFGSNPSVSVDVKHNTALGLVGLGIAGAGVALLMVGEGKRRPQKTTVVPMKHGVAIRHQIRF